MLKSKYARLSLVAAGLILIGGPVVKSLGELVGMARYNTFGYIQGAMLLLGTLLITASFIAGSEDRRQLGLKLTWLFAVVFFIVLFFDLPRLLQLARTADGEFSGRVSTYGDDASYQILAVNMAYGHGFTERLMMDPENYHLDYSTDEGARIKAEYENGYAGSESKKYTFYRAPGLPLMLSATYRVFGNSPLAARQMLAVIAWLTAILLLLLGVVQGRWLGAIAGGLIGLYHLHYYPGLYEFSSILTEIPAAFGVTAFSLFLVVYLKNKHSIPLVFAALSFAYLSYVRVNLFLAFPLILVYLLAINKYPLRIWPVDWRKLRDPALFGMVVMLSVGIWSYFGSTTMDQLVVFTTQGGREFPSFNNILVLEGVGPDHAGQGGWQAGKVYDENGRWVDSLYYAKPGQSGWMMGFQFWFENFKDLPRLFYVKLRRGFWHDNFWSINALRPEGIHLIGIGYILMALGFRAPKRKICLLPKLSSRFIIGIQLGLIGVLWLIWNQVAFWLVCLTWLALFILALARPYGDAYRLPFVNPSWFLIFVICHAVITMLFTGYRYHWPMDPPLMVLALLGIFLTLYELLRQDWRTKLAAASYILTMAGAVLIHHF